MCELMYQMFLLNKCLISHEKWYLLFICLTIQSLAIILTFIQWLNNSENVSA